MSRLLATIWFRSAIPLFCLAAPLAVAATYAVIQAPVEALQGPPQKIFYLHVSLAWVSFVLFGGVLINGILYFLTRNPQWDWIGHGLASAGFVYMTAVLVTGPIWAKPIWGVWWVWEPRLATSFLLWVLYAVYHLIRLTRGNDGWTARVCAGLGIFAFADIPIIHMSVLWWRTLHPTPVVFQKDNIGGGLDAEMVAPLLLMSAFLFILGLALAAFRGHLRQLEDQIEVYS